MAAPQQRTPTTRKGWDEIMGEGALVKIDGSEYTLSPVTSRDLAEFISHIRTGQLRNFYGAMDPMYADQRPRVIATLLSGAFGDQDIVDHALTVPGALWLLERSLLNAKETKARAKELAEKTTHADLIDKAYIILGLSGVVMMGGAGNPPEDEEQTGDKSSPT